MVNSAIPGTIDCGVLKNYNDHFKDTKVLVKVSKIIIFHVICLRKLSFIKIKQSLFINM